MSFKPMVSTDGGRSYASNALRFATEAEAIASARELMGRWMLVTDYKAEESTDLVNYEFVDGRNLSIAMSVSA